jgi:predicted RNA-binding protein Jag
MTGFVKSALNLFGIKTSSDLTQGANLDEFLKEITRMLGYNIEFRKEAKEGSALHYEIEGAEAKEFLGGNSNMIEALSHVCMRILRKQAGFANQPLAEETNIAQFRVTFDSKGFRESKNLELKEMAEKARERVIESGGRIFYLPALSPSERKVIHTHLAELGEVTSESIGTGTFKRIRVKLLPDSPHRRQQAEGRPNNRGNFRRNNNNNNNGGRGGFRSRGGGNNGGRFRNKDNQQNFNRSNVDNNNEFSDEVNGNIAYPDQSPAYLDDNIGNRAPMGNRDDDFNGGNNN